jgi:hypothetical protein
MRSALVAAALAAVALTLPALAQAAGPQSYGPAVRSGPYIAYGPVCDRAAFRACQADAQFKMSTCDPFPGRFACADRILAEQSACWAATGCN